MKLFLLKHHFSTVKTRFLHKLSSQPTIFHLRTYLYSYLFSKSQHGELLTYFDQSSLKNPTLNASLLTSYLQWLTIPPSPSPILTNKHKDTYIQQIKQLINEGKIYLCFCGKELKAYDGECRGLSNGVIEKMLQAKLPYKVRLKQPEFSMKYKDLVYGEQEEDPKEDPAIEDPLNGFSTMFKSVILDHTLGVTHIFQPKETFPQLIQYLTISTILYNKHPTIISLPPLLSTPMKSIKLETLKEEEYEPSAVLNFVALLGWKPFGDSAGNLLNETRDYMFEMEDLVKYFDVDKITKQAVGYEGGKLRVLNRMHLKKNIGKGMQRGKGKQGEESTVGGGIEEFRGRLNDLLGDDLIDTFSDDYLRSALTLISKSLTKWSQLPSYSFFFTPSFPRPPPPKLSPSLTLKINNNLILILRHLIPPEEFTKETLGEKLSQFLQDFRREVTPEEFYRYFKYCICGQPNSKLSALEIAGVLGHGEVLARVEACSRGVEERQEGREREGM